MSVIQTKCAVLPGTSAASSTVGPLGIEAPNSTAHFVVFTTPVPGLRVLEWDRFGRRKRFAVVLPKWVMPQELVWQGLGHPVGWPRVAMAGVRVVWIVCGCCPFDSYPLEWLPNNRRVSCCVPSWRALASACLGQIGCRGTQPHRVPGVLNAASPICSAVASRLEATGRCCRGGGGRGAGRRRGLLGRPGGPAPPSPEHP